MALIPPPRPSVPVPRRKKNSHYCHATLFWISPFLLTSSRVGALGRLYLNEFEMMPFSQQMKESRDARPENNKPPFVPWKPSGSHTLTTSNQIIFKRCERLPGIFCRCTSSARSTWNDSNVLCWIDSSCSRLKKEEESSVWRYGDDAPLILEYSTNWDFNSKLKTPRIFFTCERTKRRRK